MVSFRRESDGPAGTATYRINGDDIDVAMPDFNEAARLGRMFDQVFQNGRSAAFRLVRINLDNAMSKARADMKLPRES